MCRNLSYSTAQRFILFFFLYFEKFIDIFELPVTWFDPHELCQTERERETVFYYFLDMFSFFLFSVLANFDDHFSIFIVIWVALLLLLDVDPTHLMRLSDDINTI